MPKSGIAHLRSSDLRLYFFFKKFLYGIGSDREEVIVYGDADALLALSHAEGSAELDLVAETFFCDKILKSFNNLTRAFDMARGAYTNCYFHHNSP